MFILIPKGMIITSHYQPPPLHTEHALPNKRINIPEVSIWKVYNTKSWLLMISWLGFLHQIFAE